MAPPIPPAKDIHPRDVANKSDRRKLLDALRMTLDLQSATVRRNTQTFNQSRYRTTAHLQDYDALKSETRRIKEDSIERLPELTFERFACITAPSLS